MAIVQETYLINGHQVICTYSDSGRYVVGGNPYGEYTEAYDPAEFNRTYIEGDPMPPEDVAARAEEINNILLGIF